MNASDYLSAAEIKAIEARDQSFGDGESEGEQAAHDRAALLRHHRALTGSVDGEALGLAMYAAQVGLPPTDRRVVEAWRDTAEQTRASYRATAIYLHALGHAAGALSREPQIAAIREESKEIIGNVVAQRDKAEGEAERATAEGIDIGRARAWKEANVEIDRLVAQRAERDAEIARLAAELAEAERLMGAAIDNAAANRERALDAEAKLATARAEGAREEREACAKLCDDAEPCINPADLAYAIRARGDQ